MVHRRLPAAIALPVLVCCLIPFALDGFSETASARSSAEMPGVTVPDLTGNDPHWMKTSNNQCWAYNPHPAPGVTLTWTGACRGQLLSGHGTLSWHLPTAGMEQTVGDFEGGFQKGTAIVTDYKPNGTKVRTLSGEIVNSDLTGIVTATFYDASGRVTATQVGQYSNGSFNGRARVESIAMDGTVSGYYEGIFAKDALIRVVSSARPNGQAVASNYGGSGAEATSSFDDAMRADLKEVVYGNGTPKYPRGMLDILAIPNLVSLRAETVGDYFFWKTHDSGNNQGIHWSSDKDLQDFVKARRWYQFSLDRQTIPNMKDHLVRDIEMCDYALSNESDSARSQIAGEKKQEQAAAEEKRRKLAVRKKVGDCVAIPGGTGLLGLFDTIGTVTRVSGDTVSWVAHLHRNGHWAPAILGGSYYVAPQDFDREGSSRYDEVSACNQH